MTEVISLPANRHHSNVVYIRSAEANDRRNLVARIAEEHQIPLRRFLRIRLANEADREEVAQEVFLRMCRQEGLDAKLSFGVESTRAYLFKVAANLIRDMKRRASARHSDCHDDIDEHALVDEQQSIESKVATSQQLEVVSRLIENMPANRARAFLLSRYQGLSYREISEHLEVSCSTVEKYVATALDDLRRAMKQHS